MVICIGVLECVVIFIWCTVDSGCRSYVYIQIIIKGEVAVCNIGSSHSGSRSSPTAPVCRYSSYDSTLLRSTISRMGNTWTKVGLHSTMRTVFFVSIICSHAYLVIMSDEIKQDEIKRANENVAMRMAEHDTCMTALVNEPPSPDDQRLLDALAHIEGLGLKPSNQCIVHFVNQSPLRMIPGDLLAFIQLEGEESKGFLNLAHGDTKPSELVGIVLTSANPGKEVQMWNIVADDSKKKPPSPSFSSSSSSRRGEGNFFK
jgi:hypothetical protein